MHGFVAVVVVLAGCGGATPAPVAPAPVPAKTADTVAMTDPCDGGETKEDPCDGGEANQQVAIADPCDGGEVRGGEGGGGLGVRGMGGSGGGGGDVCSGLGLGSVGTIGGGSGTGSGYGSGRGRRAATPSVQLGKLGVTGKLPPEVVRRIVAAHTAQLRNCYEKQLAIRPDAAGSITLDLLITPTGSVGHAKATGIAPALESCISGEAIHWKFPKPKSGPVKVSYPMTFAPAP